MSIKEMDQSTWMCYQLPNSAYYYGQMGYLDENGIVHPKDILDATGKSDLKMVRHGFGIYLYPPNQDIKPKYQGNWDRDVKNGKGQLITQQGTIYQGNFKDGLFHDHGKIVWTNGNSYEGMWKSNRMEGPGIFKHYSGCTLKGSFKSNFFIDDNILRNPFMSQQQYQQYRKETKEVIKQKQKNQRIRHGFTKKLNCNDKQGIFEALRSSNQNNRVPLVLSTEQSQLKLRNFQQLLNDKLPKCNVFDLRGASLLEGQFRHNYKQQLHINFKSTLQHGQALIINLDETQQEYDELFYPDIKEWYDSSGFNEQMWCRNNLKKIEIKNKVIPNQQPSQQYQLIVWSKLKLNADLTVDKIKQKVQTSFQSILPFIKIDIVFIQGQPNAILQQNIQQTTKIQ